MLPEMRLARLLVAVATLGALSACGKGYELDYDQMVFLDAESLAEAGIGEAYQELLPTLKGFVQEPAEVQELVDPDRPSYSVRSQGVEYRVYAPDLPGTEYESWGRATFAFFEIVNRQLENSSHRFYAFYSGNDLGGMFLTESECEAARRTIARRSDWPYIPANDEPWFGQYH